MSIKQVYENMKEIVMDETLWLQFGTSILLIILIFVLAKVAVIVLHKSIDNIMKAQIRNRHQNQERRFNTVRKLLKNTASYIIYFIMCLLILAELGISLGPLLAGAGIAGIAIGFGAQNLVKDIITGFFIVIEDQFAVGDTIQTGAFKGVVEVIGLRTTRLVSDNGEVHIIPNSAINQVTNFSINKAKLELQHELSSSLWTEQQVMALREMLVAFSDERLLGKLHVVVQHTISGDSFTVKIYGHCNYTYKDDLTEIIYNKVAAFYKTLVNRLNA